MRDERDMRRSTFFSCEHMDVYITASNGAKMIRPIAVSVLLGFVTGLAACDKVVDVPLSARATAAELDFTVVQRGKPEQPVDLLRWVLVQRCRSDHRPPLWVINIPEHNSVVAFRYGTPPVGWSTYRKAEQLMPGCYYISANGPTVMGTSFFSIDSLGHVVAKSLNDIRVETSGRNRD